LDFGVFRFNDSDFHFSESLSVGLKEGSSRMAA